MSDYIVDMPVKIIQREGAVKELGAVAAEYGRKAAVVVDPYFSSTDTMDEIRTDLRAHGITFEEYSDISSNPHNTAIDKMTADVADKGLTVVIAIGGGSAIDTAKAVAIAAVHGGTCWDYTERAGEDVKRPASGVLPLIAVPTTSGTGSEATPYAVINNPDLHLKATIVNHLIFPAVSILDPGMTKTMPPQLTALTGIDTFAHCFEAYISRGASSFTDMAAKEGMRLFAENIERAVHEPDDMEARTNMALASMYGGMAIARKGTTAPHAIGQALGGLYNAPHGGSLAAVLAAVVRWTLPDCAERFAETAVILDPATAALPTVGERAAKLPEILEQLWGRILSEPVSCSAYGLTEEGIPEMADAVLKCYYGDCLNHPKVPLRDDIVAIIRDSL